VRADFKIPRGATFRVRPPWRPDPFLGAVAACSFLTACSSSAQEALRQSLAGDAAAEARHAQSENLPYTFRSGDLRLLVQPALNVSYNDNINTTKTNTLQDFIISPSAQLSLSYPLTHANVLSLSVGLGYDAYLEHTDYSGFRVTSGSALSFDMYMGDFWINFHDRFSYTQNAAGQSDLSGAGDYGGFDNVAGLTATWDLRDFVLTAGYDHRNFISSSSSFDSADQASELFVGRGGFRFHPTLTAGLEASGSFTTYDQPVLNDNKGYSLGLYGDWRPGHFIRLQVRGGYTAYYFDQTSTTVPAQDQNSWYFDLTAVHDVTKSVSYAVSFGHGLSLGIQADAVETWYFRPAVSWKFIKDWSFSTSLSYERGTQGLAASTIVPETYDYLGLGFGLHHQITKKLSAGLNYHFTLRSSDIPSRDYSQNLVTIGATYSLQ
jgi:hypothetical protein